MWNKLVPKEYGFYDLFNRHAASTLDGARTMVAVAEEWPEAAGRVRRIEEIEHECDSITHMTIDLLHRTFITPIDRDEILRLVSTMDDVMDLIDSAARRLVMFEIKTMPPKLREMTKVLLRTMELVVQVVEKLRTIKDIDPMRAIFIEIHRLENEGDGLHRTALVDLFRECAQDPLLVIKLKEIYETVENAIDRCEDIANVCEGILLEHA